MLNVLETSKSMSVIRTVKYADGFVRLAEKQTVLQGMTDRLVEVGRRKGMEENVENVIPSTDYDRSKTENVEYFNYLRSLITRDVRNQIQDCRGKSDYQQKENTGSGRKNSPIWEGHSFG